ncbi:MAG TPA: phosphoribosyltransferase family protein [Acetobacteraceae bacterium]|jgi:hypoxanthine phosphoribosyltransferase|nr:phosphoribosyltransferase family protein [Acetobacteraceae bacterium]
MNPTGETPWKGLDTSQMPVFIGYDQVERMIASLLDEAAAWRPDAVVAIARGGLVPAAMAAGILALPLSIVGHDATTGAVTWIGPPSAGRRILLVDDCCSSGNTLQQTRTSLTEAGHECLTLVVVHDPDTVRHLPDLSHPMRALFRLPWERGEATPTGRAAKVSGTRNALAAEAPFFALGVDETLLAEIASGDGPLRLPSDRAVLICGLAEPERARVVGLLATAPYRNLPLEFRPLTTAAERSAIAQFKAETATRWGCTHFIECDAEQAIRIAAHAPHLIVEWWPAGAERGWVVGAAAQPEAAGRSVP